MVPNDCKITNSHSMKMKKGHLAIVPLLISHGMRKLNVKNHAMHKLGSSPIDSEGFGATSKRPRRSKTKKKYHNNFKSVTQISLSIIESCLIITYLNHNKILFPKMTKSRIELNFPAPPPFYPPIATGFSPPASPWPAASPC